MNEAHRWPCTSPRRHHCRNGSTSSKHYASPAQWGCKGWHVFQGPLRYYPIDDEPDRPRPKRLHVPVTNGRWCWFQADFLELEP
jgi:hypothetical protein